MERNEGSKGERIDEDEETVYFSEEIQLNSELDGHKLNMKKI